MIPVGMIVQGSREAGKGKTGIALTPISSQHTIRSQSNNDQGASAPGWEGSKAKPV